jgi:hypothetical protein
MTNNAASAPKPSLLRRYGNMIFRSYGRFVVQRDWDYLTTPIVIVNRNRFEYLEKQVTYLHDHGFSNLIILDNESTYEPLLRYYEKCPAKVVRFSANYGHLVLWRSGYHRNLRHRCFVYTDSDVVPSASCPTDFMAHLHQLLKKHTWADKVGLGLITDDLPENYEHREKVLTHEAKSLIRPLENGAHQAWLDTTFALYAPCIPHSVGPNAIRTGAPYVAKHLPWYRNRADFTEEDHFYHASCRPDCGHWTNLSQRGVDIIAATA